MRHTPYVLLLLLLLCCFTGCFAATEHICIFDRISRKAGPPLRAIVRELPDRERGGTQVLTASVSDWAPIRFKVFSEDMNNPSKYCTAAGDFRSDLLARTLFCRQQDFFTAEKKSIILNRMLPEAMQLHIDRLHVKPEMRPVVVPFFSSGTPCGKFEIPSSHHTAGVYGADMVLYAAAAPIEGTTLAWAVRCFELPDGRPVVGVINIGPHSVTDSEFSVRVAAHEIAHAIGFGTNVFEEKEMIKTIPEVRGKKNVVVVSSPKTLEKTRAHFKCTSAPGMELEDEGGGGMVLSHWKRRNAKDELMAAINGAGYYTALTMAAFEDMGFFRAQWSMAEQMSWGSNSGCELLTEKCLTNGVTRYPEMFCSSPRNLMKCASDRLALGRCKTTTFPNPLPATFQYFTNPRRGGLLGDLMDYCPYIRPFRNTHCVYGDADVMRGSRIGPRSRCFKVDGLRDSFGFTGDVCAEVSCDNDTVSVRYLGDDVWHACPEGKRITPSGRFRGGKIVCPRRIEVCPQLQKNGGDREDANKGTDGGAKTDPNLDVTHLHSVLFPLVSTAFFFVVAVGAVW
ncbi:GP63 group I member a protein [Trypanosoma rangeli]|uniref:Leishmanolysin-like peptidase n=1 Tax=Trypanosoma rangeli TaxID=5698 RepID=A0A422MZ47_TRYRA|nr:GP63 group I member a protein [Trypanosoma rangeli]RNE98457.1 GP63 group I member a protein [Trypanosoma rangeli]|eukprot:RNE98457.1 GP63 group I member a protein [Trypanosoma rangeli]